MQYRTMEGETLDQIVWKHYGTQDQLLAVLQANPGLAKYRAILPAGLTLELPPLESSKSTESVRLWD